jgi:hypothetical protein
MSMELGLARGKVEMMVPLMSSGTSMTTSSNGSSFLPFFLLNNNVRLGDLELEAFTAHVLAEDGNVELAAAVDGEVFA